MIKAEGCRRDLLNDAEFCEKILKAAAEEAGTKVIGVLKHRFQPEGVSVLVLISESHNSVHTWPEQQLAQLDFFSCGVICPKAALKKAANCLEPKSVEVISLIR